MTKKELLEQIKRKESFLCVGLDPDMNKIPAHLLDYDDPIFEFNKAIIDATHSFAVAYKPNTAFFECHGSKGWDSLEKTINYIPKECLIIADAKRGDIGNTSTYYAKTFFETLQADAVTVAPYMGSDSVLPFTKFDGKWVVLLALTSNEGAKDFQLQAGQNGLLFENVLRKAMEWASPEKMMFVVGATRAEDIAEVRKLAPDYFFLVPGVGAQGGSLEEVVQYGANHECGLLVNSSRGIIYASNGMDFADAAKKEALKIQSQMALHVQRWNF
jgi:orotidine-5'-phosphate decarboxylase